MINNRPKECPFCGVIPDEVLMGFIPFVRHKTKGRCILRGHKFALDGWNDQHPDKNIVFRLTQWALSLGIVIQAETVDDALDQIANQLDELPAPVVAQL